MSERDESQSGPGGGEHGAPEASTGSPARTDGEGHGDEGGRHHPNYMAVWAGLAVLTLIEVGVAFLSLPREVIVLTLLGLAVWKALLVALYFMHLRFESRRLVLIAAAPLALAPILVFAVLAEF